MEIVTSPILAEFQKEEDKIEIINQAYKLKDTKIIVQQDYTFNTRRKRGKLLAMRKHIINRCRGLRVVVSRDRLIVNNTKFTWCTEKGIVVIGEKGNGLEKLNLLGWI